MIENGNIVHYKDDMEHIVFGIVEIQPRGVIKIRYIYSTAHLSHDYILYTSEGANAKWEVVKEKHARKR